MNSVCTMPGIAAVTVTPVPRSSSCSASEKLVTKAKHGGVHKQRLVVSRIHDKDAAKRLFDEIGPRYADRNGGYLRILKLGPRSGDNAPMVRLEFV